MGFSRQEYWTGLPFPPLGDLPEPGIEPSSSCVSCSAGGVFMAGPVVKYSPCNAEDVGSIPGRGTKIPCAS